VKERLPPVFAPPGQGRAEPDDEEAPGHRSTWPFAVYGPDEDQGEIEERLRESIEEFPDFPRPGIVFRDMMPVLRVPELLDWVVGRLAHEARLVGAGMVAGIESRGFLFAAPLAIRLGLPLFPIRKSGKLPGHTLLESYALEYGDAELELQSSALRSSGRVFLVDDLLATGGTLVAACNLIERGGGEVAGVGVVVELAALRGADRLTAYELVSLLSL
jgi:adenine phosphoribosyltransferase